MAITYKANCSEGYYQYDRFVTVDKRLNLMPYAQAGVINRADGVQLVSYETIVAEIIDNWLHVYGTFSASTRRHIGAFMREYAAPLSYYDAKRCFLDNMEINVLTGEVRTAADGMIQTIGRRHAA